MMKNLVSFSNSSQSAPSENSGNGGNGPSYISQKPKRKGCYVCGCILLVPVFLLLIVVIGSMLPDPPATGKSGNQPVESATAKEFYSIGETITLDNHTITVNKFKQHFVSSNPFDTPQSSGNQFVVVNVTTKNTSNDSLSVNMFGFELEDDAGVKRSPTLIAGMDNSMESADLQPGGTITGNLAFEARKGSKVLILHYTGNISSGGAKVRLK